MSGINSYSQKLVDKIGKKENTFIVEKVPKSEPYLGMKPKIPKSGKSLYREFYVRKIKGTQLIYHKDTGIYIWSIHKDKDVKLWIDEKYDKLLAYVDRVEKGEL